VEWERDSIKLACGKAEWYGGSVSYNLTFLSNPYAIIAVITFICIFVLSKANSHRIENHTMSKQAG